MSLNLAVPEPDRTRMIKVYVTPEEKRRVQQMAQMLGCSMSEVLQPSDPNRSRGPVSRLRRRVDLRMLTLQFRRLLEKMEGAGREPAPDGRLPSSDPPGVAFDEALVADLRDLIDAAQQALSALPQEGVMGDLGRDADGATDTPQPRNR